MTHPFHLVDVFAERPYAGNQLAVVTHADDLADETMQQIATEMNFSETTFVYTAPERDGGHRVRIFTPAREIAFAGHPILGTAWVIREQIAPGSSAPVRLNLAVGQIPVAFEAAAGISAGTGIWPLATGLGCGTSATSGNASPAAAGLSSAGIAAANGSAGLGAGT